MESKFSHSSEILLLKQQRLVALDGSSHPAAYGPLSKAYHLKGKRKEHMPALQFGELITDSLRQTAST